jgi:hypothetical protein
MEGEPNFRPLTAREALLEIRRVCESVHVDIDSGDLATSIELVAMKGLERNSLENFELVDQLADRLGEAHQMLKAIAYQVETGGLTGPATAAFDVGAVLSLPPDLEAMVERRL